MPKSKSRKKKPPKRVLALPGLEHAKTAVVNSLTSASGPRTYDSSSLVLFGVPLRVQPHCRSSGTGFTSNNGTMRLPLSTFDWPRFGAWRSFRAIHKAGRV
jgi:hypothetical protein